LFHGFIEITGSVDLIANLLFFKQRDQYSVPLISALVLMEEHVWVYRMDSNVHVQQDGRETIVNQVSRQEAQAYDMTRIMPFKSMSIFGRFTIFGSQCRFLFGDFSEISALNC
jgi:hypothetical protein